MMSGEQIRRKLQEYGADIASISNRFDDDYDFYIFCLEKFFEDEHFGRLAQALEDGNITAAFESAHALKGISGNLGLTPFFSAVCELVEALRLKATEEIAPKYALFTAQAERLRQLHEDE